jgi:hypothetical protein
MFDTTKLDLSEILKQVHAGSLQLPDFQRSYVWGEDDVRSLLASVGRGFPVGALLTLETGGTVNFKPRRLEGVPDSGQQPEELLLDGQQRMTSLYQATYSELPVKTKTNNNKVVTRYFYIDMRLALANPAELEMAIVAVPENRKLLTNFGKDVVYDLTSADAEYEQCMFPVNKVFDSRDWFYGLDDHWQSRDPSIRQLEREFVAKVLHPIERYKMPVIRLDKSNSREAICLVFEKVNVGGKKLDAFELVTAVYAADEYDLRHDWMGIPAKSVPGRLDRMIGNTNPRDVLKDVASTDFLQACTLLYTREQRLRAEDEGKRGKDLPQVTCKRDALLGLPLDSYRKYADTVEKAFVEAASFLNELKIIWHRDVPYPPQVTTLAATLAVLGNDAKSATARKKLERWFWSVALGELYGSSTEFKMSRDVPELVNWIRDGVGHPQSLNDAVFQAETLKRLRTRKSAPYKAVHALLMFHGCRDFITGRPTDVMTFFNDDIDIHHIFPRSWCTKRKLDKKLYDSIINKTPLSKRSNIIVGGSAPSEYLKKIENKHGITSDELDTILRSHLIEPEHLRTDNFDAFIEARSNALSDLVSKAMEKPVVMASDSTEQEPDLGEVADEDEAWAEEVGA